MRWWRLVDFSPIDSFPRLPSSGLRPQPGVYLAHKARGATSFSLVRAFQQALAQVPGKAWKVCHGGTLDPFAAGLLPILVGPATKLFELLHELPKTYVATMAWGEETDSDDGGGRVVRRAPADQLTAAKLDEALLGFLGWTQQVPPVMSNKRVEGERAHVRARRGETVQLAPVRVYLHSARWRSHDLPKRSELELTCRGGFYVRSLARDLARGVGSAAHLVALRRTEIGPWSDESGGEPRRIAGADVVPWLRGRKLTDDEWGRVHRGEMIATERLVPPTWALPEGFPPPTPLVRATHLDKLLALLEERSDRTLAPRLLLRPGLSA